MSTPAQCIEARKLLGWSRYRLASRCDLSYGLIREFEIGKRTLPPEALSALQRALEREGIEFADGGEPGVKLRKQP